MAQGITLGYFGVRDRHYNLRRIGETQMRESHYHDFFQICYVLRGGIEHCHGEKRVLLGQGDAFIVPPGLTHRLVFTGEAPEIYSLSFDEGLFSSGFSQTAAYRFLAALGENAVAAHEQPVKLRIALDPRQQQNVQSLFECLSREQEAGDTLEMSAAASLIAAILYTLAQSYYRQPQNEAEFSAMRLYEQTLARCVEYLDENYREHITLDILVKKFAMSRSSFCTLFPQFTGLSLKQYLTRKRILEAEALMRSRPELTLSEIASMVGYNDTSTFYRNFIRVAGVSPSEYKALALKA